MHQDKKREELEQKNEFEQLQQEELFEQVEIEIDGQDENLEQEKESGPVENEIERAKKKRRELVFEFALFCILGILLGVTIKTEAIKKITIGFNDYQIESGKQRYDIAGMKKNLQQKALEQQKQIQSQTGAPQAPTGQEIQVEPQL